MKKTIKSLCVRIVRQNENSGGVIELKAQKNQIFLITSKENATVRKRELELLKKKRVIATFSQTTKNNEFHIIFGKGNYTPPKEDYYSYLYSMNGSDPQTIIYPRIVLGLGKKFSIEKFLEKFKGKLEVDEIREEYDTGIFKCNVKNASEVIKLVNEIAVDKEKILWREPEMSGNIELHN